MALDRASDRSELGAPVADAAAHAGRGPVLAEDLAQGARPFAGRAAGMGQGDGGRHDVVGPLGRPPQRRRGPAATAAASRSARHASTSARSSDSTAGSTRRMDDDRPRRRARRPSGRVGRLGEAVDPDHRELAGLDAPDPLGLAARPGGT